MFGKYGEGQDRYCYPDSDVLINLLGITDNESLNRAEVEFTRLRLTQYDYPVFKDISLVTLKNIHFYLFQDIYDWAGELRTSDISKGRTRFATSDRIEPEAKKLFEQLKAESYLRGSPRRDFIARMAHYFCELNVIHPFRDGNGRAQRLLFESIAINAGYEIRWQPISQSSWLSANVEAYLGRLDRLRDLFDMIVSEIVL